jgi:hypothetical protein
MRRCSQSNKCIGATLEQRIRVLVVTNTYPTEKNPSNGIFVKEMVDVQRQLGLDVGVFYIGGRRTPLKYAIGILRLWGQLLRKRYDLIHAYYVYSGIVARMQLLYPVIVTLCGSDVNLPSQRPFSKFLYKMVSRTIVQTQRMKELLGDKNAIVMHMGVNLSIVRLVPQSEARSRLGLSQDSKFALFPYDPSRKLKRYDLFIGALTKAKRDQPALEPLIMKGLPKEWVPIYMSAADVLVLTSDIEGSPNTVKEALACGLPIVSVDVGDVVELITGIDGCWICEAIDDAIAQGILKAVSFGRRTDGRKRALEFSSEITASKLMALYEEVLNER